MGTSPNTKNGTPVRLYNIRVQWVLITDKHQHAIAVNELNEHGRDEDDKLDRELFELLKIEDIYAFNIAAATDESIRRMGLATANVLQDVNPTADMSEEIRVSDVGLEIGIFIRGMINRKELKCGGTLACHITSNAESFNAESQDYLLASKNVLKEAGYKFKNNKAFMPNPKLD